MSRGVVKRVIDGDTIELRGGERIRIAALNAPEREDLGGEAAKRRLQGLLKPGTCVGLSAVLSRSYSRTVRRVTVAGKPVARLVQGSPTSSSRRSSPRRGK